MIEHQTINGRSAVIAYMTDKFEPTNKDTAALVKIIFDDGEVLFLTPTKKG